ncbi:MAG TPA: dipeptidase PepE [Bacteroidales bacterium]|nr:dipeptidase PepE [Bacteroidales bacterium]HSA43783.1 dipeptidase PepE [Bacteroidales bacterium]
MNLNLLLISNSTNPGEEYLGWPRPYMKDFLQAFPVKKLLFVPFAGVTISWDDYTERVRKVFAGLGYELHSLHQSREPLHEVHRAEAIVVGGGNTFSLVRELQRSGLMHAIRERCMQGIPYLGWSAGSNITCPSLRTTNDMPIVQPDSFECMNLIPFQINPHYLDAHPEGHGGETREQRIAEFLEANPGMFVAGLRESCLLEYRENQLLLKGAHSMRLFRSGQEASEIPSGSNLDFLL